MHKTHQAFYMLCSDLTLYGTYFSKNKLYFSKYNQIKDVGIS